MEQCDKGEFTLHTHTKVVTTTSKIKIITNRTSMNVAIFDSHEIWLMKWTSHTYINHFMMQ